MDIEGLERRCVLCGVSLPGAGDPEYETEFCDLCLFETEEEPAQESLDLEDIEVDTPAGLPLSDVLRLAPTESSVERDRRYSREDYDHWRDRQ